MASDRPADENLSQEKGWKQEQDYINKLEALDEAERKGRRLQHGLKEFVEEEILAVDFKLKLQEEPKEQEKAEELEEHEHEEHEDGEHEKLEEQGEQAGPYKQTEPAAQVMPAGRDLQTDQALLVDLDVHKGLAVPTDRDVHQAQQKVDRGRPWDL